MIVTSFRLSCIWADATPELLQGQGTGPLAGLMDRDSYATRFDQLLNGSPDALVDLPWAHGGAAPLPLTNHFWYDMILRTYRACGAQSRGRYSWKAALPLSYKPELLNFGQAGRAFAEGFYYPHGVAFSVTSWMSGSFTGEKMKQAVSDFSRGRLALAWPDGTSTTETIDSAAAKVLDRMSRTGFAVAGSPIPPEKWCILTIVSARHDEAEVAEKDRAAAEAAMLADAIVAAGGVAGATATQDRDIHALPRARVIWSPERMLSTLTGIHTLGCLHRNIKLATLHIASLVRAAEVMVADFQHSGQLPVVPLPYERRVAGLLGRFYGMRGADTDDSDPLYVQPCMKAQVEQARQTVDDLRLRLGMPALK